MNAIVFAFLMKTSLNLPFFIHMHCQYLLELIYKMRKFPGFFFFFFQVLKMLIILALLFLFRVYWSFWVLWIMTNSFNNYWDVSILAQILACHIQIFKKKFSLSVVDLYHSYNYFTLRTLLIILGGLNYAKCLQQSIGCFYLHSNSCLSYSILKREILEIQSYTNWLNFYFLRKF